MTIEVQEEVLEKLAIIHADINACRQCEPFVENFLKPLSMSRGQPGSIIIVGQEPGKGEVASQRAFSGRSGQRLDQWLVASGFYAASPRSGIYTTSVAKCLCEKQKLRVLYGNCSRFLERQLRAIQPTLIISLGAVAYQAVRFNKAEFKNTVCTLSRSDAEEAGFHTNLGFDYALMSWPHPSPGSRWHNSTENRGKLQESFDVLRDYVTSIGADLESKIV